MSIYSTWAHNYLEMGFSVIPIDGDTKRPAISNWQSYCHKFPTEREVDKWSKQFAKANIGVCLGPASGIVAFDYDYEWSEKCTIDRAAFEKDRKQIERHVLPNLIPHSPVAKTGKKGWTKFYRYDGTNKSRSLQRFGVPIFDFLATGRQTVIPPSVHPETGQAYTWHDPHCGLLDLDREELEFFVQTELNEVYEILDSGDSRKGVGGRHGKLFYYALDLMSVSDDYDKIAVKVVAHDMKINDPPYSTDIKYNMRKVDPVEFIKAWLPRIARYKQANKKVNKREVVAGYPAYEMFFDNFLDGSKKDFISGKVKQKDEKGVWQPTANRLPIIRAEARDKKLQPTNVEDYFYKYEESRDSELLFEKDTWDGVDYIAEFFECIECDGLSRDEIVDLGKSWLAGIFKKLYDKEHNHMILIHGSQGIGKDEFIYHLTKGFDPYVANLTVSNNERDNYQPLTSNLIVNVAEFDRVNKQNIGMIKDMITAKDKTFRAAYARSEASYNVIASFIGSVNNINFLTDYTGNRRFWPLVNSKIKWSYPTDKASQIVAQARHLYDAKFVIRKETKESIDSVLELHTPDSPQKTFVELWEPEIKKILQNRYRTMPGDPSWKYPPFSSVVNSLKEISSYLGFRSVDAMQKAMKTVHYKTHRKQGRYYHSVLEPDAALLLRVGERLEGSGEQLVNSNAAPTVHPKNLINHATYIKKT